MPKRNQKDYCILLREKCKMTSSDSGSSNLKFISPSSSSNFFREPLYFVMKNILSSQTYSPQTSKSLFQPKDRKNTICNSIVFTLPFSVFTHTLPEYYYFSPSVNQKYTLHRHLVINFYIYTLHS